MSEERECFGVDMISVDNHYNWSCLDQYLYATEFTNQNCGGLTSLQHFLQLYYVVINPGHYFLCNRVIIDNLCTNMYVVLIWMSTCFMFVHF